MTADKKPGKLGTEPKDQGVAMEKLESSVAENKEAAKELEKSLKNLEEVTHELEEGKS